MVVNHCQCPVPPSDIFPSDTANQLPALTILEQYCAHLVLLRDNCMAVSWLSVSLANFLLLLPLPLLLVTLLEPRSIQPPVRHNPEQSRRYL